MEIQKHEAEWIFTVFDMTLPAMQIDPRRRIGGM
jgi:hypothetical protein